MGIQEIEYGADCLDCFLPGRTPRWMYLSFTGIEIGPLWVPPMDPPPNYIVMLEQVPGVPCHWQLVISWMSFLYRTSAVDSAINCQHFATTSPFDAADGGPLQTYFVSRNAPPAPLAFYSGTCQVSW